MGAQDGFHSYRKLRCVFHIVLLIGLIPLSILYVVIVTLTGLLRELPMMRKRKSVTPDSKLVMITGGKMSKSLHFARWFWKNGYRVVMVETEKYCYVGSRWSRAVTYFETVTCPRKSQDEYMEGLVRIAKKYNADFFVPVSSPVASVPDSAVKPRLKELGCKVLHFDLEMTKILDDKHKFGDYSQKLGLRVPETFCVSTDDEVRKLNETLSNKNTLSASGSEYILKNIEYDPIHRLDLFKMPCDPKDLDNYLAKIREDGNAITSQSPWQVQQFIAGDEYTCMAVLREGNIRAITTSASSPSQLNYEHVDIPGITEWVESFAKKTGISGQICFDFMKETSSGLCYPLECNPRVHSQCVTFLDTLQFGEAVLSDNWNKKPLVPPVASKPVFWFYNELFKAFLPRIFNYKKKVHEKEPGLCNFLSLLLQGRDSDFDISDPLPFLLRNHCQLPYLLLGTLVKGTPWRKLDFCIGKVVELHGD